MASVDEQVLEAWATRDSVDVVIVGAGPTGLILANLLGLRGVHVAVVEARADLIDYPRGVGMDDETMRVLQSTGLIEQLLPHTVPNQKLICVNKDGKVLASFAPTEQPYGWPRKHGFIQPLIDAELLAGLSRFPHVAVHWGWEMRDLRQDGDGVTATAVNDEGRTLTVDAKYLVGCDGGRSWTRKALGVGFDGISNATRWLVLDLENDPVGTPNAYIGCDPRRPYVSISLPHGVRRFEFMLFPHESDEDAEAEMSLRLLGEHLQHPEKAEIIRRRVYTHHARVAATFLVGRVLVAGDAAHLMPVWQGQGYNSGVRDAANLAWKLAMVVRGEANGRLLRSYDTERRPHATSMVNISQLTGRYLGVTNPFVARVRDAVTLGAAVAPAFRKYFLEMRFKPMPVYTDGAVVGDDRSSPVGRLFPQPEVVIRGTSASRKLDDVLGDRLAILRWGSSPRAALSESQLALWSRLGATFASVVPMTQLDGPGDDGPGVIRLGDVTRALREWFDANPYPFVFLRPDRIVGAACLVQAADTMSAELADVLCLTESARRGGASEAATGRGERSA